MESGVKRKTGAARHTQRGKIPRLLFDYLQNIKVSDTDKKLDCELKILIAWAQPESIITCSD